MRKSLLITSALGLVSALPTFAMASAAGSTAAACASGFFAQIDAKIMNAKLQIKNEKGSKSTVEAPETDAEITAKLKADFIEGLSFVGIFDFNMGLDNAEKQSLYSAVGNLTLAETKADTSETLRTKIDALIDTTGIDNVTSANITPDMRAKLVDSLLILRDLGVEARLPDNTKLEDTVKERADKLGDVVEIIRTEVDTPATTAAKLNAALITDTGNNFKIGKKIYVVGSEFSAATPTLDPAALKKALQAEVEKKLFNTDLDTTIAASVPFKNLVNSQKINKLKFNAQLEERKKLEVFGRHVHHHALAGGVGATAGWWQNMGGFAFSISGSGDYLWGTLRTEDDASGSPMTADQKRKLGFGFQGDVGVHYVVSPSTTLGVLVGLRGQQLQIGRNKSAAQIATTNSKNSSGDYASKWMWNPVVSAQARTFFTDTVYGALTVGYVIPMSERDYKLENTNIRNKDAKVRFQALTGAFSVGMMF